MNSLCRMAMQGRGSARAGNLARVKQPAKIQEVGYLKRFNVLSIALIVLALIVLPVATGCGGTTTTTAAPSTETTATTMAPSTETTTPASTETTMAPSTETTAPPTAEYDINTILAGIQADPSITVPDKYKGGTVVVASDAPYPPWEYFVGETDQFTGFDYDLGQAIGAKLGVSFEFVKASFDGIIVGIQAGNYDVAMSAMYDNAERQALVDFVDYSQDGTALLVKKGNPEGIMSFEDLAGKAVAAEKGTTQAASLAALNERFKTEGKPVMTISEFPDQPAALLAVQSSKVVCDLTDASTGAYIAMTTDDGATFEVVVDPNPPVADWKPQLDAIAVLKGNDGLRDAIQKALQALMDDGTYTTIIEHYGIVPIDQATINAGPDFGM
jgi:polar amino acid transport system substrate-binding protein